MLEDNLVEGDFDTINHLDFAEWLSKHGSIFEGNNALIRAFYDAAFAYENGDFKKGMNLAAGTALYACLRLLFTYRGSLMWRMEAGMGDTIFTPLYQVLKNRGVKFQFFHKVTDLVLSADKTRIEEVKIDVQAEPIAAQYEPLVPVPTTQNGLQRQIQCWPSAPLFNLLKQGREMQNAGLLNANVESWWSDWQPNPPIQKTLRRGGQDENGFDLVVLGISLGALPFVCKELIGASGSGETGPNAGTRMKWRRMIDNLKLVRTQGVQLWLNRRPGDMGFEFTLDDQGAARERPLLCSFVEPFDTWCDMSHLIPREGNQGLVTQIAYFCNAAPNDPSLPAFTDHTYPVREAAKVAADWKMFLENYARIIWPKSSDSTNPKLFDRSQVVGEYTRLNVEPPDQYVLSVKGSGQYRLAPWDSGYDNLFLAGDWTKNILDIGCVEAAVMSGKLAAAAIGRRKANILGRVGARVEGLADAIPEVLLEAPAAGGKS
jgi:uncharacterized protein with NAD-binding domain and iron-sulfur cluster